jgi:hypothetical protein
LLVSDADAFGVTSETDRLRGIVTDPRRARVTMKDHAEAWMDRRTDIRPTTRAKYQYLLDRHIVPALGAHTVGGVAPSVVRGWYARLRGDHQVTADDAYRLLRAVLNTAVADEIISRNPCQVKGAGQVRAAEHPVASLAEVQAAVDAVPVRYRVALLLAAWCQLRRGESPWTATTGCRPAPR